MAITPAAGYVPIGGSVAIGVIVSLICYMAVEFKNKMGLDDALDVWGVHGIGGVVGCICTGIFASKEWNPGGADGLLNGGTHFFLMETLSVVITAVSAFVFSYGSLWLISKVMRVKASEHEEEVGLDSSLHGELAYEEGEVAVAIRERSHAL